MTRAARGARLVRRSSLLLVITACSLAGHRDRPAPPTASTLPPASVAFLATARQLGVLGEDDEILLLGLDYCGLARRGPIEGQLAKDFKNESPPDRQQAALILTAAARNLCPDQSGPLTLGASEVMSFG